MNRGVRKRGRGQGGGHRYLRRSPKSSQRFHDSSAGVHIGASCPRHPLLRQCMVDPTRHVQYASRRAVVYIWRDFWQNALLCRCRAKRRPRLGHGERCDADTTHKGRVSCFCGNLVLADSVTYLFQYRHLRTHHFHNVMNLTKSTPHSVPAAATGAIVYCTFAA